MCVVHMPKVALVKNIRFGMDVGFSEEKVRESIGEIVFCEVSGTMDVWRFINESLVKGEANMVEVANCVYTENLLIQGFSVDTNEQNDVVFVKRKLMEGDTYTYVGFDPENDVFEYLDLDDSDILRIVGGKAHSTGVIVGADGIVRDMCYMNKLMGEDVCVLRYRDGDGSGTEHELKYVNLQRIVGCSENGGVVPEERGNVVEARVAELLQGGGIHHVYSNFETPFGLLNCFYVTVGTEKNEIMSKLLGSDVYGDVLVGLENNCDNNDMIIDLDSRLFRKMVVALESPRRILKNRNFFNVYYELAD